MRVSEGFDGQCAAQTFLLVDRNMARNPAQYLASTVRLNTMDYEKITPHFNCNHANRLICTGGRPFHE